MAAPSRRHLIFLAIYLVVIVAVTVPVIPAVWSARVVFPGLPASMLWVIAALTVIFAAVLWLFVTEEPEAIPEERSDV